MRKLSPTFIANLTDGFLAPLHQKVLTDNDLDLQIRDNYLNIYFKGNSLLNLKEVNEAYYTVTIHPKFVADMAIPDLNSAESVSAFLQAIPHLKENIIQHSRSSLEIEYEQLIIRANNREKRNSAEYLIIDRQYAIAQMRFDLLGVYWPSVGRRSGQTVAPCLMEVKFALNSDIRQVHEQLARYYDQIREKAADIAQEAQTMFHQRLDLGLYTGPQSRLNAMKTLTFAHEVQLFQFIIILVDYNLHSTLLNLDDLAALPFANQIKIFHSGFAMWGQNLRTL
jgi:hypothetical protein